MHACVCVMYVRGGVFQREGKREREGEREGERKERARKMSEATLRTLPTRCCYGVFI